MSRVGRGPSLREVSQLVVVVVVTADIDGKLDVGECHEDSMVCF